MRNDVLAPLAALAALAGCSAETVPTGDETANDAGSVTAPTAPADAPLNGQAGAAATNRAAPSPPVEPPAPGTPGGLPDHRTPVSEAPFSETSAQGAAHVVQTYYALLESGRYRDAWALWSDGGKASGMDADAFAASFAKYSEYHAQVGAPGAMGGAAGSSYVEVPVVVYGRLKSGGEVRMNGPVTLRRVNDVPGSTAEQRTWHLYSSEVKPRPR
jgi:hypothetical protein